VLVQTAKWLPWVEVNPNSEQLRFSVYLALLYGSKGIFFDQVFAKDDDLVGGIINAYANPPIFSPLFDEIKDNIYPRTSGLFGRTLRNTQQTYQQSDYDAITAGVINQNKIKKIEASLHGNVSQLDFGFFDDTSDTAKDYFMIVNRYYSKKVNFNVHLYNLIDYSNWAVKNYMDSTSVTVTILPGNEALYNTDIELGDAGFYSVLPVVKYGGSLIYDEEITSSTTLYAEMTIENGAELSISDDYRCNANIIVKDGSIVTTGSGAITFLGDSKLIKRR
jgi:hypothetical protein